MPMLREDRQVHSSVLVSIHQLKRWGIDLGLDILEHPVVTVAAPLLNAPVDRPIVDVVVPLLAR